MIQKIDHINIVVRNIEESIAFFQLLDFIVEDRAILSGEWISNIVGLDNIEAEYVKLVIPGTETRLELAEYA